MNPEAFAKLERELADLRYKVDQIVKGGQYMFSKNVVFNNRIIGGIYPGLVASGGTATFLPTGWTVVRNSAGYYTITHGFSNTNYVVLVTGESTDPTRNATIENRGATSFDVLFNGSVDTDFHFLLMKT